MIPYAAGPFEFETHGSAEHCILLKVPSRGFITSLRLVQLSGAEMEADFEMFTAEQCCAATLHASESLDTVDIVGNRDAYSVFGPKTRNANVSFEEYEKHYAYQNKDGGGVTNRLRRLYLAITPKVDLPATWELSMDIVMPVAM